MKRATISWSALVSVAAWRHEPDWLQTPSWEHEAAEHRAVLQAAEDGDAEGAAALLQGAMEQRQGLWSNVDSARWSVQGWQSRASSRLRAAYLLGRRARQ